MNTLSDVFMFPSGDDGAPTFAGFVKPTPRESLSDEFVAFLASIKPKRVRRFIDAILAKGFVTTEDIKNQGYGHPPRSAQDAKDHGIPLITTPLSGRGYAYTFGDFAGARPEFIGRAAISKSFRDEMLQHYGCREAFSGQVVDSRLLQIDHRVPYQVGGDPPLPRSTRDYMLLGRHSQREKSAFCERCPNFQHRDPAVCRTCFFASPEHYDHIGTRSRRRLVIEFDTDLELDVHSRLGDDKQAHVKAILTSALAG